MKTHTSVVKLGLLADLVYEGRTPPPPFFLPISLSFVSQFALPPLPSLVLFIPSPSHRPATEDYLKKASQPSRCWNLSLSSILGEATAQQPNFLSVFLSPLFMSFFCF